MTVCIETRRSYEQDSQNFTVFKGCNCYRVLNERNNKNYFVAKKDGVVTCTCQDWLFRKSRKNEACKHQLAVLQAAATEARLPEMPVMKIDSDLQKYIDRW